MGQEKSDPHPLSLENKRGHKAISEKLNVLFPETKGDVKALEISLVAGEVFPFQADEAYFVLKGTMHEQGSSSPSKSRERIWLPHHEKTPGMILFARGLIFQHSDLSTNTRLIAVSDATVIPISLERIREKPEALLLIIKSLAEDGHRGSDLLTTQDELNMRLHELVVICKNDPTKPQTAAGILSYLTDESTQLRIREKEAWDTLSAERESNRIAIDAIETQRAELTKGSRALKMILGLIRSRYSKDDTILHEVAALDEQLNSALPDQTTEMEADGDRKTGIPGAFFTNEPPSRIGPMIMPTHKAEDMPNFDPDGKTESKPASETHQFVSFDLAEVQRQYAETQGAVSQTLAPPSGAVPPPALQQDDVSELIDSFTPRELITAVSLPSVEAPLSQPAVTRRSGTPAKVATPATVARADEIIDDLLNRPK